MRIEIVGRDLPGRTCRPDRTNVHLGLQQGAAIVALIAGDAESAHWSFECEVAIGERHVDLRGPYIHGRPDDRFIYLSWVTVTDAEKPEMFRRAKLPINTIDQPMLREATRPGTTLVCLVNLTDENGQPRAGSVRSPDIEWSVTSDART